MALGIRARFAPTPRTAHAKRRSASAAAAAVSPGALLYFFRYSARNVIRSSLAGWDSLNRCAAVIQEAGNTTPSAARLPFFESNNPGDA